MEYNKSFALVEAIALVGLTGWLFYINSLSGRGSSETKEGSEDGKKDDQDGTGQSRSE